MSRDIWIGIVVVIVLVTGGWWYLNMSSAPATSESAQFPVIQNTNSEKQPVVNTQPSQQKQTNTQTQPIATQPSLQTFRSGAGFQLQYPSDWKATSDESNLIYARIINPDRAGKPDTDVPSEQFLVRRFDVACTGNQITFAGKSAQDSGWYNDNFAGTPTRTVCLQLNGVPIQILAMAFDQNSKNVMAAIFASFTFTQ